ncbi:MAG: Flp family type IVb pilin [Acetobacteraceae bacterium]|nr:Flp family type IVb pilin [Acetobacteraceae bacterium]
MLKAWTYVSSRLAALKRDERGVSALEYGIIAALIIVVAIGAITAGGPTRRTFTDVAGSLRQQCATPLIAFRA